MRKVGIGALVFFIVLFVLLRPWQKAEDLTNAICIGNEFWSFVHIYRGADLNIRHGTDFSTTPLLEALDNTGCPKLSPVLWAKVLVWFGADVNFANGGGYTPP